MRTLTCLLLCASAYAASSPANYNIALWEDGKVPLSKGDGPLDKPFLTVFKPAKPNGGSVVIAPGGSNIMLMYGGEGMDVAERFNEWGVTAFVLTYRLSPRYADDARVLDGNRAIQLVREKASEFGLDPKRVGYIGFSAGSNMGRIVVAGSTDPSSRPDYLALIYGPGRATPNEQLKNFPPVFLCAAQNDKGPSIGSANFFTELTRAGVPAELHLYQKGRHGFGSGFGSPEYNEWMSALKHFLVQAGMLK